MNQNIIRTATDLIDLEPSNEFVDDLGRQLLATFDDERHEIDPAPPVAKPPVPPQRGRGSRQSHGEPAAARACHPHRG